jgi:hypothetical protein
MFGLIVFAFLIAGNLLEKNVPIIDSVRQWSPILLMWHRYMFYIIQACFLIFTIGFLLQIHSNKTAVKSLANTLIGWVYSVWGSVAFITGSRLFAKYRLSNRYFFYVFYRILLYC